MRGLTDTVPTVNFACDGRLGPISEETLEIGGFASLHDSSHISTGGQVLLLDETLGSDT